MYDVRTDLTKNRIYITLGRVVKEEVPHIVREIKAALPQLNIGFTCVTDISGFDPQTQDEMGKISEIQKIMAALGMSRVVRVVGTSKLPQMLMDQLSKASGGYTADTAETVSAADTLLDG